MKIGIENVEIKNGKADVNLNAILLPCFGALIVLADVLMRTPSLRITLITLLLISSFILLADVQLAAIYYQLYGQAKGHCERHMVLFHPYLSIPIFLVWTLTICKLCNVIPVPASVVILIIFLCFYLSVLLAFLFRCLDLRDCTDDNVEN